MTPLEYNTDRAKLVLTAFLVRETAHLPQREAAARLKTKQPTVSQLRQGDVSSISLTRLLAWVLRLGFDIDIHITSESRLGPGRGALTVTLPPVRSRRT